MTEEKEPKEERETEGIKGKMHPTLGQRHSI